LSDGGSRAHSIVADSAITGPAITDPVLAGSRHRFVAGPASIPTKNIADSEVLNEVSQ
jgi:hypothetical protein